MPQERRQVDRALIAAADQPDVDTVARSVVPNTEAGTIQGAVAKAVAVFRNSRREVMISLRRQGWLTTSMEPHRRMEVKHREPGRFSYGCEDGRFGGWTVLTCISRGPISKRGCQCIVGSSSLGSPVRRSRLPAARTADRFRGGMSSLARVFRGPSLLPDGPERRD